MRDDRGFVADRSNPCIAYDAKKAYGNNEGRLAQLVEQLTLNQWVTGSNPVAPAVT